MLGWAVVRRAGKALRSEYHQLLAQVVQQEVDWDRPSQQVGLGPGFAESYPQRQQQVTQLDDRGLG